VDEQIAAEVAKEIVLNFKPMMEGDLYKKVFKPCDKKRKAVWEEMYSIFLQPFIQKSENEDKLILLKQRAAHKKRLKQRQRKGGVQSADESFDIDEILKMKD
jgi:hypothetical protein